jgi:hypothetical protein
MGSIGERGNMTYLKQENRDSVLKFRARIDAIRLALGKLSGEARLPYSIINWEKTHGIRY